MIARKRNRVTFFKTVTSDHGSDVEIPQRTVDIVAEEAAEAVRRAKAEFCRREGIDNWAQHAGRYAVESSSAGD
jgi:hypothetical protein